MTAFPFPFSVLVGRSDMVESPSLTFCATGVVGVDVPPPFLAANLITSPFEVAREVDLGEDRTAGIAVDEEGTG